MSNAKNFFGNLGIWHFIGNWKLDIGNWELGIIIYY